MRLEERIEAEFKISMKQRNGIKVSTIRMLKADINNFKLEKNKKDLTDDEIIKIIQRHVKQHKDSIEQFEKGKRTDLAEKEKKELDILHGFLPEQLSDEGLEKIVAETVKELGATEKKEMGRVMKAVMEKVKGKAEGKRVSRIASGMLK